MTDAEQEALRTAESRIVDELRIRSGTLDLSGLDLPYLPNSLFALRHLRKLNLSGREIWTGDKYVKIPSKIDATLKRLREFPQLEDLNVSNSDLSALATLGTLSTLESLDCSSTRITHLLPVRNLSLLQTLRCNDNRITDLLPLRTLSLLQTLECKKTLINDLSPISSLFRLQELDCAETKMTRLSPLRKLTALQTLRCDRTQITDLSPLSDLPRLWTLDCSSTGIVDLTPLGDIPSLRDLKIKDTAIADLEPLRRLENLENLSISNTKVTGLSSLADIKSLEKIDCSNTAISDLSPLSQLTGLKNLECGFTRISNLSPLINLRDLRRLSFQRTDVDDLSALENMSDLMFLNSDWTKVTDLSPVSSLLRLLSISARGCHFDSEASLPVAIWRDHPSLKRLVLVGTTVPSIPQEVLDVNEKKIGCLEALRVYFATFPSDTNPPEEESNSEQAEVRTNKDQSDIATLEKVLQDDEDGPPTTLPLQGAGPHFTVNMDGLIAQVPASDLDSDNNNIRRIRQLLPLVKQAIEDAFGRLQQTNAYPELVRDISLYRNIIGLPEAEISWPLLWGYGVRLEEAIAAADRKVAERMTPELEDDAYSALQSWRTLHAPMILATAEGLELQSAADASRMTREEQASLKAVAAKFADDLAQDDAVITPGAAYVVEQASLAATAIIHPNRGATFTISTVRNVSIVLTGAAFVASAAHSVGGILGAGILMGSWEVLKKNPTYASAVAALGENFERLSKLGGTELKGLLLQMEPFYRYVLRNQANLRKIAATTKQESWMDPLINLITRTRPPDS